MLHPRIIIARNPDEVGKLAADVFESQIQKKPACVIGLATGSTSLPLYRELIEREKDERIDFSRVRMAYLAEYKGLSPTHENSYCRFMKKNLLDHISIRRENTIVPYGLAKDVEKMCQQYEDKLEEWGGVDLQLLGIGHDGHIGFNEPDNNFPAMTHEINLTDMTIAANKRFFNSEDEVPRAAFTMGIGTIMAARKIVILVTGEDKRDILRKAFWGPVDPQVPASILQFHPDVTLICDIEAYPM